MFWQRAVILFLWNSNVITIIGLTQSQVSGVHQCTIHLCRCVLWVHTKWIWLTWTWYAWSIEIKMVSCVVYMGCMHWVLIWSKYWNRLIFFNLSMCAATWLAEMLILESFKNFQMSKYVQTTAFFDVMQQKVMYASVSHYNTPTCSQQLLCYSDCRKNHHSIKTSVG